MGPGGQGSWQGGQGRAEVPHQALRDCPGQWAVEADAAVGLHGTEAVQGSGASSLVLQQVRGPSPGQRGMHVQE
eukprot:6500040-Alexandrium_andersonii.AAC.1